MPQQSPSNQSSVELEVMKAFFFIVAVPVAMMCSYASTEFVMEKFALNDAMEGNGTPWSFITHHLARGICSGGGLFLSLICALSVWKLWPDETLSTIWMSCIWFGNDIVKGLIIFHYCPGILRGHRVTERWHSFDSYIHDSIFELGFVFILVFTFFLIFFGRRKKCFRNP